MIQFVKHFTFRVWTTLLTGGLLSLALLSAWQAPLKLEGLIAPVAVVFGLMFFLIGWIANRSGLYLVDRLRDEAVVWERAGQLNAAEAVFKKALALYDSFLFSPRFKKKNSVTLIAQMARFYLSRADKNHDSETFILTYLDAHPEDGELAKNWLQQIGSRLLSEKKYQDIASRIGDALPENLPIQQLLANLYLSARRTDFAAQQVYQRALSGEGVTAADLLQKTQHLLEGISDVELKQMPDGYTAPPHSPPSFRPQGLLVFTLLKTTGSMCSRFFRALLMLFKSIVKGSIHFVIKLADIVKAFRGTRKLLKWSAVGIFGVAIIVLVVNTIGYFVKTTVSDSQEKRVEEVVITDPYTLQVAAYLKPEHAKQFVATLKKLNIDAYWTEAVGENKNWYQVRVSHFSDKKSAIAYGEELKSKGIINDFFVANY